jgi:hypothetical protein
MCNQINNINARFKTLDFVTNKKAKKVWLRYKMANHAIKIYISPLYIPNITNMNTNNQQNKKDFISNAIRILVLKLTQNPEYYNIKQYSKSKMRNKYRHNIW